MSFVTGQKMKLSQIPGYHPSRGSVTVTIRMVMGAEVDFTCFGLDAGRLLSDDRYMVFYNQTQSPQREIRMEQNERRGNESTAVFEVNLSALPEQIKILSFAATIDGAEMIGQMNSLELQISQNGAVLENYRLSGSDFNREKAVILFEIYYNQEWRVNAVGKGFDGGLDALLKHYGGEVEREGAGSAGTGGQVGVSGGVMGGSPVQPASTPAPSQTENKKVSLEKRIEREAPALVSLTKTAKVSLEKAGLADHTAKVALCLDISGSMAGHYRSGEIQRFAERILALGTRFDDDGSIDIFLFGKKAYYAGECSISNYRGFIDEIMKKYPLEGYTNYQRAIRMIREHYISGLNQRTTIRSSDMPTYVMFLTDGDAGDRRESEKEMILASYEPIFWSFMGIGKGKFSFLEKLDELRGRCLDNASLLKAGKPSSLTDNQLYDGIMKEYKTWVPAAKSRGLIRYIVNAKFI